MLTRRSWICFLFFLVIFVFFSACKKGQITEVDEIITIPPPEKSPGIGDSTVVIDNVEFVIKSYFWQDFMPMIPKKGPPFYLLFKLKITNKKEKELVDFCAVKTTLYYEQTNQQFHSFYLIPTAGTKPEEKILPGQTKNLEYTNDRSEVFSPKIEQGTKLYAQILLSWNRKEHILTSLPSGVEYTY